jgi:competence protein ComEA
VFAAVAAVVAVVLGGILVLHHQHAASTYPPSYDASTAGSAGGSGSSYPGPVGSAIPTPIADATSIVVDVGGRVHKPGLVTLPPGARVADAIAAAGGPLRHREIARVDLAARVTDGQLLLVGVKSGAADPAAAGPDPAASGSAAPVALNTATLDQLDGLPGIGPVLGQNIIDWRTAHSGFTSIEQLQQVSGIGPATYAELSPLVTL